MDENTQHALEAANKNLQSVNDLLMDKIQRLERDKAALKQIIELLLRTYAEN